MLRRRGRWAAALFVAAAPAFTGFSCSREAGADAKPQAKIVEASDPAVVEVKDDAAFPLVPVETVRVPNELSVTCVASPDVERTVHVYSLSGGRVVDIRARLGDDVRRGQPLVLINSADLASAIADYKKAQADQVLARRQLDRAKDLFSHGALAAKDLQQAEDSAQKADVDFDAAAAHIRLLGGDLANLSPVIEVKSPIDGTVVEQNTAGGEGVKSLDSSPNLFTIADLSRVWILCDVYENDLGQVHVGDLAEVRLNAYPDRPLRARVSNISRILDPATRTAKVRIEMDNPGGIIRPGMFGNATFVSRGDRTRMVVPAAAVLRLHDKDWVFRFEGPGRFRRTEVRTGPQMDGGRQQILGGALKSGDRVAGNALQLSSAAAGM